MLLGDLVVVVVVVAQIIFMHEELVQGSFKQPSLPQILFTPRYGNPSGSSGLVKPPWSFPSLSSVRAGISRLIVFRMFFVSFFMVVSVVCYLLLFKIVF